MTSNGTMQYFLSDIVDCIEESYLSDSNATNEMMSLKKTNDIIFNSLTTLNARLSNEL